MREYIGKNLQALASRVFVVAALGAAFLSTSSGHAGLVMDSPSGFALRSQGSLSLDGNVKVFGSVGAAGSVSTGYGTTVTGVTESGSPHSWTSPTLPLFPTPGLQNVNVDYAVTTSIAPGNYASFTTNSSAIVNVSAGIYDFSSFSLGWNSQIAADTSAGDVYIFVNGALSAADATRFTRSGTGNLFLISQGSASFGYQSNINGAIYSNGALSFGGQAQLNGLAWAAGSISAGYGSTFTYAAVPAPGALAALALAGVIGGRRRR